MLKLKSAGLVTKACDGIPIHGVILRCSNKRCGKEFTVTASKLGRKIRCPQCKQSIVYDPGHKH